MDVHITNRTKKSREVVYVIEVRQLFSKHRVSLVEGVTDRKNVVCCAVK